MQMIEHTGGIRRIIEKENVCLVALFSHDGYFKIPPSTEGQHLKNMLIEAKLLQHEVTIQHDREYNIINIA